MELIKGTVKSFNAKGGFGFITAPDGEDISFTHTAIQDSDKIYGVGQLVEFEIVKGPKGFHAELVRRI